MGRPKRKTGHLAGTFAPPRIQPNGRPTQSIVQSPLPTFTQPVHPGYSHIDAGVNWQPTSTQHSFSNADQNLTPSSVDALSPVSSRASFAPDTPTSYTASLEYNRHLSPGIQTPTSSVSALPYRQKLHRSEHVIDPTSPSSSITYAHISAPDHAMTGEIAVPINEREGLHIELDVLGIAQRAPLHETSPHLYQQPYFLTAQEPSPTRHQRYPGIEGPWSTYPMRHEETYILEPDLPNTMDVDSPPSATSSVRGGSRAGGSGGGRTGPLKPAQRQSTSEVRKRGACLRCTIMREKVRRPPLPIMEDFSPSKV
jgi:hypothetical protein